MKTPTHLWIKTFVDQNLGRGAAWPSAINASFASRDLSAQGRNFLILCSESAKKRARTLEFQVELILHVHIAKLANGVGSVSCRSNQ